MSLLKVSGLKKNFGKLEVLKGIDFELEKGKALSIIGSSGSGKTTLLRCLNFLETPNAGTMPCWKPRQPSKGNIFSIKIISLLKI